MPFGKTLNWWLDPLLAGTLVARRTGSRRACTGPGHSAGERDAIHPPATVRQTAARIGGTTTVMPGMSHWLPGEPGWETVAETALNWTAGLPVRTAA